MINALQLGIDFHNALPLTKFQKNSSEEGFYHLATFVERQKKLQ